MRILGFTEKWVKLGQREFTTFRFTRKDKDWQVGEVVQVVLKPRSKQRQVLGVAEIISKEPRWMKPKLREDIPDITQGEAMADGFKEWRDMWEWLLKRYDIRRLLGEPMNKLTLGWVVEKPKGDSE